MEIDTRIKKIRAQIATLPPRVIVHYTDGTARPMRIDSAVCETVTSGQSGAVKVECDRKAQAPLVAVLQAVIDVDKG